MSVVLHEDAIRRFLNNEAGPLGRYMSRLANRVNAHAHSNAADHVRSGDLVQALRVEGPHHDEQTLYYLVGTDAKHPWKGHADFNYPLALELGGSTPQGSYYRYPFLVPALVQAGFRRGG